MKRRQKRLYEERITYESMTGFIWINIQGIEQAMVDALNPYVAFVLFYINNPWVRFYFYKNLFE